MADPTSQNTQITDSVTQAAGALDAADVEIVPNPSFTPDVTDDDPDPADVRDNDVEADS